MSSQGLRSTIRLTRDGFELDASIDIDPGETVALLGPNGSGKSTVVAALAGLLPIEQGQIELAGSLLDDPDRGVFVPPAERRVAVVFQDYLLFPHMTVRANVGFGPASAGRNDRETIDRWLEVFDLTDIAASKPASLSGGQAQRVAVARAFASDPRLLLLDEPLSALDATTRVSTRRQMTRWLETFDGPSLLVTHDPTEAFLVADRVIILEKGRVSHTGTPSEIRLRPRTRYASDLVGLNLVEGQARQGVVTAGGFELITADAGVSGAVIATIHPRAISLHVDQPAGSPRNTWRTRIELVEHLGERVRLNVGSPLPLTVEVTADAMAALGLGEGSKAWVSIKATEIAVDAAVGQS